MYGVLRSQGYPERAIFVVDKQGIIRSAVVYDSDEQPDNEELFNVLARLEPGLVATPVPHAPVEDRPVSHLVGEVVLYCTPWCPDCRRSRAYLNERGIKYTEVDITRDRAAAQRVRGWANGYETTPLFQIGERIIVGFDRIKLATAFGTDEVLKA
jgi:glutaredoxin